MTHTTLPKSCNALGLAAALASVGTTTPDALHLTCDPETFVYPGDAAWLTSLLMHLKQQGTHLSFDFSPNPATGAYLARMGFFEHLDIEDPAHLIPTHVDPTTAPGQVPGRSQ